MGGGAGRRGPGPPAARGKDATAHFDAAAAPWRGSRQAFASESYYDTTIGPKREPASYRAIAQDVQLAPEELLFLSDAPEELDAAHQAGLATGLVERPGNPPARPTQHPRIHSFDEIVLGRS